MCVWQCGWLVCKSGLFILVIVLFCFLVSSLPSFSAETEDAGNKDNSMATGAESAGKKDDIPLLGDATEKKIDDTMESASALLTGAANWLDSFYDEGPSIPEQNHTRATLKLEFGYDKNNEFDFKPRLNLRLRLPKLTKKANLLITASDDDDFETQSNPVNGSANDDTDRNELQAALQFRALEGENYNISTSVGGSYNYLYAGIRFRHSRFFGLWKSSFTDRLRYYTDEGWENRASYYLDRQFSERWLFRSITSATWLENRDGLPHSQIFRLYQVLSEEKAIQYETVAYLDTEPNYTMTDLQFRVRFRKRFYRDWLVVEVAPQITFPEDHDRDANPGIIIKLEADFGYTSDREVFDRVFDF